MPFGGAGAIPAAQASAHPAMPPMTTMGGRNGSAAPTRFELRSTVIPFTPAAG
jgi:hypothetical protein